jgi:hypothetical protein
MNEVRGKMYSENGSPEPQHGTGTASNWGAARETSRSLNARKKGLRERCTRRTGLSGSFVRKSASRIYFWNFTMQNSAFRCIAVDQPGALRGLQPPIRHILCRIGDPGHTRKCCAFAFVMRPSIRLNALGAPAKPQPLMVLPRRWVGGGNRKIT